MNRPVFSLLHATARLPVGWRPAAEAWINNADHPEEIEYLLAVNVVDAEALSGALIPKHWGFGSFRVVPCDGERSAVVGWNEAARQSRGKFLIVVADDFFPMAHWDTLIKQSLPVVYRSGSGIASPDFEREIVLDVSTGGHEGIMTHPMLTRAYYERPGRGGHPSGELFYPDYLHVGMDDDFTLVAWRDGVVIPARHLKFDHRHPSFKGVPLKDSDPVYRRGNREESWIRKDYVLGRRLAEMFGLGTRCRKSIAVITPGSEFSAQWQAEWDRLHSYLLSRFEVRRVFSMSNNIYQVRENAVRIALAGGVPDYVLWIDSDNPPALDSFRWLMAELEHSEEFPDARMPVDICGAWYRYSHPTEPVSFIAAGRDGFGERSGQISEEDVLEANTAQKLVPVKYSGFGLLLMRGSIVAELGPEGFSPLYVDGRYLMDDVSWCYRATEKGHTVYLHPAAFVEHLKQFAVPARAGNLTKGETDNGNHGNGGSRREELQVLDRHCA